MIRTIDMAVLMPRSLELQQTNQNSINARADIKQEQFSKMIQEKTVQEIQQVNESNKSEQQQMINRDGRNGSGGGYSKRKESHKKDGEKETINNQSLKLRRRPIYNSMLDIQV